MLKEKMEARDAGGRLRFNAGSIAIHMISVEFVARLNAGGELSLPLHRAEKKVPFVDLYAGTAALMKETGADKLTFNGIHLTQYGHWAAAQLFAQQLGLPQPSLELKLGAPIGAKALPTPPPPPCTSTDSPAANAPSPGMKMFE